MLVWLGNRESRRMGRAGTARPGAGQPCKAKATRREIPGGRFGLTSLQLPNLLTVQSTPDYLRMPNLSITRL
jgi:hypothetical protein